MAEVVAKGIDAFNKLRESFKMSAQTIKKTEECEEEMKQLKFKSFKETSTCKCARGISGTNFEKFVGKLQVRFSLPEEVKCSILDGLDARENEETVKEFSFKDGKGDIHHGRFVTVKKGEDMDIAYAIYSLSFELPEKQDGWWWLLDIINIPLLQNPNRDGEPQQLSDSQMDKFSKWCMLKLYKIVQNEGHLGD